MDFPQVHVRNSLNLIQSFLTIFSHRIHFSPNCVTSLSSQARKETVQLERDLNRERRAKEDLESRLESVDRERQNLRREVEGLRDEVADLRTRADEDGDRCDHNYSNRSSNK